MKVKDEDGGREEAKRRTNAKEKTGVKDTKGEKEYRVHLAGGETRKRGEGLFVNSVGEKKKKEVDNEVCKRRWRKCFPGQWVQEGVDAELL